MFESVLAKCPKSAKAILFAYRASDDQPELCNGGQGRFSHIPRIPQFISPEVANEWYILRAPPKCVGNVGKSHSPEI